MATPMKNFSIFLNEPDFYEHVDFSKYPEIKGIYSPGDNVPYEEIDAVMVGLKDVIDDDFLSAFPKARYVVSNTTGTDHIQTSRSIEVVNLNPLEIEEVSATAEFTLALMLSLVRKIPFIDPTQVADRKIYRGTQLRGLQLGIIGLGRLGRRMARYAEALDMKWTSFDKDSTPVERERLFRESDLISIHIPLRDETVGFIGFDEFAMMEKKPYVINSSRPQILEKEALMDALDRDLIKGLAMDFINYDASSEWDLDLKKYVGDKLLLTPHIGGNTKESVTFTANIVLNKWIEIERTQ
jgi:D-3-phosphoglycerate dehydrogenase / 2-oxoglutarate reductase